MGKTTLLGVLFFVLGNSLSVYGAPANGMNVIAEHWQKWSDGQEEVSAEQLIDKLSSSQITEDSEAAAALAALAHYVLWEMGPSGNLEKKVAFSQLVADKVEVTYQDYYDILIDLKKAGYPLYLNGRPGFSKLRQNKTGDCYFFQQ